MWRQENENKEIQDDRESIYCLTTAGASSELS